MKVVSLRAMLFVAVVVSVSVAFAQQEVDNGVRGPAAWSVLTFMQADNNLASYATFNLNEMKKGCKAAPAVNILTQWDQPENAKTWRYLVRNTGITDVGTLNLEMGINPGKELVDSMTWCATNYAAQNYFLDLWNHGSGIEDFRHGGKRAVHSWLQVPGLAAFDDRGILYDDSQGTLLTNQAMRTAMLAIKTVIGKNIAILAMDACLMAMIEVCYQISDCADVLIASEETIPGDGFNYRSFVNSLTAVNGAMTPEALATAVVKSYDTFYKKRETAYTLSALRMAKIAAIKTNIDQVVQAIRACQQEDGVRMAGILRTSRRGAIEMSMSEYVDLCSWYVSLQRALSKKSPKSAVVLKEKAASPAFVTAANALQALLTNGIKAVAEAVIANIAGPALSQAKGLTIYFPSNGSIHDSYLQTRFAQDSLWLGFVQDYLAHIA